MIFVLRSILSSEVICYPTDSPGSSFTGLWALLQEPLSGSLYCISIGCFSEGLWILLTKPRLLLFILSVFTCVFSLLSLPLYNFQLSPPPHVCCFLSYYYCVGWFLYACGRVCGLWLIRNRLQMLIFLASVLTCYSSVTVQCLYIFIF